VKRAFNLSTLDDQATNHQFAGVTVGNNQPVFTID